ncbi:hypothetical protein Gogos_019946, partial [Gossypium gossypioides]|nr:hypothetical protein [Gossypium gossypioides]
MMLELAYSKLMSLEMVYAYSMNCVIEVVNFVFTRPETRAITRLFVICEFLSVQVSELHGLAHDLAHGCVRYLSDWINLHISRAVKLGAGFTATGGVVRELNEAWILGFNHYLGDYSVFDAELWGILDGLILLERQGYN